MARWRMRSGLIRSLRVILPAGLVLLAGWVGSETVWRQAHATSPAVQAQKAEFRLLNFKFVGRDTQGRAVQVTAAQALRDEKDLQQLELKDVVVTLSGDTPDPVRISAHGGVYREDDGLARLSGGVRIDDGRGNQFSTERSVVDSRAGKFTATGGVAADGATGKITAGSYQGTKGDGTMVFSGGVRGRLNSH
ncbi:MAG: hypothetical protein JWM33_3221 [Caulobacteraceae bacterium]|nr:hypothetical protein [Caulobacteraceae bacterium]